MKENQLNQKPRQIKRLSQVFLVESWPVQRVVEKLLSWQVTRALEIGPGTGKLTQGLLEAGITVTAVEKDRRCHEYLQAGEIFKIRKNNLELICDDILKYDLPSWINRDGLAAVVGNIPYNISSPILQWLTPHLSGLRGACLMVQWEFAKRLVGRPSTKDYGSLSVFVQLRSKPQLECQVKKGCFRPMPKVDSALVSLEPLTEALPEEVLRSTELLTRKAFEQRRKKLRNSIKSFLPAEIPSDFPVSLDLRADALAPEDFVAMARFLTGDTIPISLK